MILFFFYLHISYIFFFFFFNDTATTEIYTLSLHDALPIYREREGGSPQRRGHALSSSSRRSRSSAARDRKSTRLNSSHVEISYAVFCLKKKKNKQLKQLVKTTKLISRDYSLHILKHDLLST